MKCRCQVVTKKMVLSGVLLSASVVGSTAIADQAVIIEPRQVGTTISTSGVGVAYINLVSPETYTNCSNHTQVRWPLNASGAQEAMSIALTAQTTNRKLVVYLGQDRCSSGFPVPAYMSLIE